MKKNHWLILLFSVFFIFTMTLFKNGIAAGAAVSAPEAAEVEAIEEEELRRMIRPTLEKYMTNHPDPQVRIWSMIILTNMEDLEEEQISSVPNLVLQLANKDENIRQIALISLREALDLEEEEWKGIMGTLFRSIAKTAQYPEVKKIAIKSLSVLQELDEEDLDSLMLLFDLSQDSDQDIRKGAVEGIERVLSKSTGGG